MLAVVAALIAHGHVPAACIGDGWFSVRLLKDGHHPKTAFPARVCGGVCFAPWKAVFGWFRCHWAVITFSNGANGLKSYGDMTIIHTYTHTHTHTHNHNHNHNHTHTHIHTHTHTHTSHYTKKSMFMAYHILSWNDYNSIKFANQNTAHISNRDISWRAVIHVKLQSAMKLRIAYLRKKDWVLMIYNMGKEIMKVILWAYQKPHKMSKGGKHFLHDTKGKKLLYP